MVFLSAENDKWVKKIKYSVVGAYSIVSKPSFLCIPTLSSGCVARDVRNENEIKKEA